ncbi:MAG: thiamine ABC transporter substrate-binding protein, partial [Candidatus Phosphoribacter sp.]
MHSHHQPPGMPSHHQPGMPSRRHSSDRRSRPTRVLAGVTVLATLALTGCSLGGAAAPSTATNPPVRCGAVTEVLLVTHDSFALSEQERARFTALTGCTLTVLASGDAGALTNKLVLTKSSPIGDAVFGIDNTFASRAASEGVLADISPALPSGAAIHALSGPAAAKLAPIDYGDVCVNVDLAWFAAKSLPLPTTLDDLIQPAYRGLFVTPGATTSSPGLAFLLATIGAKGEGWQDYWRALMANDTKLTSGWSDAYAVDFSGGEGKGSRPIVLS